MWKKGIVEYASHSLKICDVAPVFINGNNMYPVAVRKLGIHVTTLDHTALHYSTEVGPLTVWGARHMLVVVAQDTPESLAHKLVVEGGEPLPHAIRGHVHKADHVRCMRIAIFGLRVRKIDLHQARI